MKKYCNTNLIHNGLNIAIAFLGGLEMIDLNPFFSNPETTLTVVSSLAITKLLMNAVRDGLTGMIKDQPPVQ